MTWAKALLEPTKAKITSASNKDVQSSGIITKLSKQICFMSVALLMRVATMGATYHPKLAGQMPGYLVGVG